MASRKSVLYLNSVLPVKATYDDVVQKKLKPGKFVFTPAGIIKVVSFLFLICSLCLIIASPYCEHNYTYRFLAISFNATAVLVCTALYIIFSVGVSVKNPALWVKLDIILNMIMAILLIISYILGMSSCQSSGTLYTAAESFAIIGAIMLIVSCAALFLLFRYREEEENIEMNTNQRTAVDSRKSIFA